MEIGIHRPHRPICRQHRRVPGCIAPASYLITIPHPLRPLESRRRMDGARIPHAFVCQRGVVDPVFVRRRRRSRAAVSVNTALLKMERHSLASRSHPSGRSVLAHCAGRGGFIGGLRPFRESADQARPSFQRHSHVCYPERVFASAASNSSDGKFGQCEPRVGLCLLVLSPAARHHSCTNHWQHFRLSCPHVRQPTHQQPRPSKGKTRVTESMIAGCVYTFPFISRALKQRQLQKRRARCLLWSDRFGEEGRAL